MKISLEWLNSYLGEPVDRQTLETVMTRQGFPVESCEELPGGDVMADVEVTSNRGDCLSHVGVARELSAGLSIALKQPALDLPAGSGEHVGSLTQVVHEDLVGCPVYTARLIRGVRVGPSPQWLVRRLEAIGLRSVNNVVDVTNYVLHELGQPLHAFDFDKLEGGRIVVRRATAGERFVAIDHSEHKLTPAMVVIADAVKPVALAGVMGGVSSEVTESTVNILLESARFDPLTTRRTSRALRLSSDSSYRYERGVDPAGVERASRRAAAMIVSLAGGELAQGVIRTGEPEPPEHEVAMRVARCNSLLGLSMEPAKMVDLLGRLGLYPRHEAGNGGDGGNGGVVCCTVPTFRLDLEREVDLIEEVARLHGMENIPTLDRVSLVVRKKQSTVAGRQRIGTLLAGHGYHETITFSFVSPALGEGFVPRDGGVAAVMIDDERRKGEPMLRPSLLPSLLACRKANQDVGNAAVRLFEVASTWLRDQKGAIVESSRLGMLCDAAAGVSGGSGGAEGVQQAMRDVRGTLEELVEQMTGGTMRVNPVSRAGYAAAGEVLLVPAGGDVGGTGGVAGVGGMGGQVIGYLGVIDPAIQSRFGLQMGTVGAEIEIAALLAGYPPARSVKALPRMPGIDRDLSIVVAESVTWETVAACVASAKPALLESLSYVTTYRGKPIEKGRKSVTLRLTFRDPQKTLRHDEVDPQVATVVSRLTSDLEATLRDGA